MTERNYFRKLESKDYELFLKYYTQIEYSYFKDGDKTMMQDERTRFITLMSGMLCSRKISYAEYLKILEQGNVYLYHDKEGEVLGITIITTTTSKKHVTIEEFYILKEYQRQHIGSQMYQDLLYLLKEEEYFKVSVTLQCSFEGAEEFWKKMGYNVSSSTKFAIGMEYRFYSKTERPNRLPELA